MGIQLIRIEWAVLFCTPEDFFPCLEQNFEGYVDNVTFHMVPEAETSLLAATGLAFAFLSRRLRWPVFYRPTGGTNVDRRVLRS